MVPGSSSGDCGRKPYIKSKLTQEILMWQDFSSGGRWRMMGDRWRATDGGDISDENYDNQ